MKIKKSNAKTNRPKEGQTIMMRGSVCVIVAVRPAGTVDVEALDASRVRTGRFYRISGLPFSS